MIHSSPNKRSGFPYYIFGEESLLALQPCSPLSSRPQKREGGKCIDPLPAPAWARLQHTTHTIGAHTAPWSRSTRMPPPSSASLIACYLERTRNDLKTKAELCSLLAGGYHPRLYAPSSPAAELPHPDPYVPLPRVCAGSSANS